MGAASRRTARGAHRREHRRRNGARRVRGRAHATSSERRRGGRASPAGQRGALPPRGHRQQRRHLGLGRRRPAACSSPRASRSSWATAPAALNDAPRAVPAAHPSRGSRRRAREPAQSPAPRCALRPRRAHPHAGRRLPLVSRAGPFGARSTGKRHELRRIPHRHRRSQARRGRPVRRARPRAGHARVDRRRGHHRRSRRDGSTIVNPVAERLTGWRAEAASGRVRGRRVRRRGRGDRRAAPRRRRPRAARGPDDRAGKRARAHAARGRADRHRPQHRADPRSCRAHRRRRHRVPRHAPRATVRRAPVASGEPRRAHRPAQPARIRASPAYRARRARATRTRTTRCCTSTSTSSRSSTTPADTPRATSCCARSARCCAPRLREGDTLARLGGDEFGVLLAHCPPEPAARIAENAAQADRGFPLRLAAARVRRRRVASASSTSRRDRARCPACCRPPTRRATWPRTRAATACRSTGRRTARSRCATARWTGSNRIDRALAENRLMLYAQPIVPLHGSGPAHHELLRAPARRAQRGRAADGLHSGGRALQPDARDRPLGDPHRVRRARTRSRAARRRRRSTPSTCRARRSATSSSSTSCAPSSTATASRMRRSASRSPRRPRSTSLSRAAEFMGALRASGCRFALDDFGVGCRRSRYLKHLPVDFLKIDGSFVKGMLQDPVDARDGRGDPPHRPRDGQADDRRVRRDDGDPRCARARSASTTRRATASRCPRRSPSRIEPVAGRRRCRGAAPRHRLTRAASPPSSNEETHGRSERIAIVTGAGSGIGRAVGARAARRRLSRRLAGRRREPLRRDRAEAGAGDRALAVPDRRRRPGSVRALFDAVRDALRPRSTCSSTTPASAPPGIPLEDLTLRAVAARSSTSTSPARSCARRRRSAS